MAQKLFLPVIFCLLLAACGEVGPGEGLNSNSSNRSSSSESSHSSSSSNGSSIDLDFLDLQVAPEKSQVHGTTKVEISPYRISKNLITQRLYKSIMNENPIKGEQNDALPVSNVNWFGATDFCKKLSVSLGLPQDAIRLPTEAEWEFAAYANVITTDINYWEWTNDCFDSQFPLPPNGVNPSGPPNCNPKTYGIVRKGFDNPIDSRFMTNPDNNDIATPISFRVVIQERFLE